MFITKGKFRSGVAYEYDNNTLETVASGAPFQFCDDFVGAGHTAGIPAAGSPVAGYAWVKKIVGAAPPTVAPVSNGVGGQLQMALSATSEAEEASLYWNDSLAVNTVSLTTQHAEIEWRAQLAVLPSAAGVQAFLGLGSAWVGGPQNLARYVGFGWTGSGALLVWSKDGAGDTYSFAASPIGGSAIVTDTNFHLYRIEFDNLSDIAFLVDGNRVNAPNSVVWNPSSAANAVLQPWHTVYKPSGAGLATLNVDKTDIFTNR